MQYLIKFQYKKKIKRGIGTVVVTFPHNPPTAKDVKQMEEKLENECCLNKAIITNWLPLSEEDDNINEVHN
ncbi:MAG: hypothetical protein J1F23_08330 [Oscillospiraceae bacterium]|nr:hypothetical protein [Oscillospiraceae bacterium]